MCGAGAHVDRWHDLPATTASLASALATATGAVVATATTDDLDQLSTDLVIVNASGDLGADPVDSTPAVDALLTLHATGVPLLAVHSSAYAFRDDPRWARLLGGRWVPGASGHPPSGPATIDLIHPAAGTGSITVLDERYMGLEVHASSLVVATHIEEGATHPLVWLRDEPARVAYSALGHDSRSHTSAGHRMLLTRLVAWLTEPRAD